MVDMTYRTESDGPQYRWASAYDTARDFAAWMLAEYGLKVSVPDMGAPWSPDGPQERVEMTVGCRTLTAWHNGCVGGDTPEVLHWSRSGGDQCGRIAALVTRVTP